MPTKYRVLLVDDDREFADVLCRRLLKSGYQVTALHHPRRALEAASQTTFHVAVLDRSLPEIDGVRLMRMLKGRIANLQVVFLSGHDNPAGPENALADGAFAYLTKPCTLAEIEATIERAAERHFETPLSIASKSSRKPKEPTVSPAG